MGQLIRSIRHGRIWHITIPRNRHRGHLIVFWIDHHQNIDIASRIEIRILSLVDPRQIDDKGFFGNIDLRNFRKIDLPRVAKLLKLTSIGLNRFVSFFEHHDPIAWNDQRVDLAIHQLVIQHIFDRRNFRIDLRHGYARTSRIHIVRIPDLFIGQLFDRMDRRIVFYEQRNMDRALRSARDIVERPIRIDQCIIAKAIESDQNDHPDFIERGTPAFFLSLF